jgi:4-carboxymuconolactone decarboxylase
MLQLTTTLRIALAFALPLGVGATSTISHQTPMMVRLSEIEIAPGHLEEYVAILKKEAAASVRLEPGVIAIFPMSQQEHPNQIRILEIYADRAAYESHLQTPHFQEYKTSTLKMVRSLKLVDMRALDAESMSALFRKLP